jgi:hypothetical protein
MAGGVMLNPDEINALMSAIQDGRVPTDAPKKSAAAAAVPYDLTSQDQRADRLGLRHGPGGAHAAVESGHLGPGLAAQVR